jgi:hypothetical protein
MQLYLAAGFPDHKVENVGVTFSRSRHIGQPFRLAGGAPNTGITIKAKGQFARKLGFTLNRLIGLACNGGAKLACD